ERGAHAFREAAIDLLARHLRENLTNGWGRLRAGDDPDTDVEIVNIAPWSMWSQQISAVDEAFDDRALGVYRTLQSLAPEGWLPADANDETIRRVFDAAWAT